MTEGSLARPTTFHRDERRVPSGGGADLSQRPGPSRVSTREVRLLRSMQEPLKRSNDRSSLRSGRQSVIGPPMSNRIRWGPHPQGFLDKVTRDSRLATNRFWRTGSCGSRCGATSNSPERPAVVVPYLGSQSFVFSLQLGRPAGAAEVPVGADPLVSFRMADISSWSL